MKKLPKDVEIKIPIVKLYLDDVKALEDILKQHFNDVKIIADDYEFDTAEELKQLKKVKIHNLDFKFSNYQIRLYFEKWGAFLRYSSADVKTVGIASSLKEIIFKRLGWLRYLDNFAAFVLLPLIISFASYYLVIVPSKRKIDFLTLWLPIYVIWCAMMYYYSSNRHSTIYLYEKSLKKNFFSRNKDKIILAIISILFGFVLNQYGKIIIDNLIK